LKSHKSGEKCIPVTKSIVPFILFACGDTRARITYIKGVIRDIARSSRDSLTNAGEMASPPDLEPCFEAFLLLYDAPPLNYDFLIINSKCN